MLLYVASPQAQTVVSTLVSQSSQVGQGYGGVSSRLDGTPSVVPEGALGRIHLPSSASCVYFVLLSLLLKNPPHTHPHAHCNWCPLPCVCCVNLVDVSGTQSIEERSVRAVPLCPYCVCNASFLHLDGCVACSGNPSTSGGLNNGAIAGVVVGVVVSVSAVVAVALFLRSRKVRVLFLPAFAVFICYFMSTGAGGPVV